MFPHISKSTRGCDSVWLCQGAARDQEQCREWDKGKRDNRWQGLCMLEDQVKPHLSLRFWIFRGSQTQFPQKSTNLGTGIASFEIANSKSAGW